MDNFNNSKDFKIPYDHTPIFRSDKTKNRTIKESLKIKLLTVISIVMIFLNVALCITCHIYLQNGKIKVVNIYNDTFSTTEVSYLKESMRNTKYSTVCVSAGIVENKVNSLLNKNLTNDQFYNATKSHGAGFLYKIDEEKNTAYFITCFHVIDYNNDESLAKQTRIWILPPSMLVPIEVELIGYSAKDDVAVLRYVHENITASLEGMIPVNIYDSTFITEFEDTFTIGNPLNYGLTGTSGEIISYRHILKYEGDYHAWIKTDTPINPGNSGGGFFNADGKLIGMVNANIPKTTSGGPVSNIAYAIPGTLVISIADNIIENNLTTENRPKRANLGITLNLNEKMGVEQFKDAYKDRNGEFKYIEQSYVVVSSFDSSSIAKNKLKVGDRLVSMEISIYGEDKPVIVPIVNTFTFYEYSYAIKPNSQIKFTIQRQNISNVTEEINVDINVTIFS